MQTSTVISNDLLRNEQNYKECLRSETIEERKGVKYDCFLNRFRHYKEYLNFCIDIIHDTFLGVFKYDLVSVLRYYIKTTKKFISIEFNEDQRFDYGPKQKGNMVCVITDAHLSNKKLQMNAKEVWSLVEYLPLILSKLVSSNCRIFKFVVKMSKMLSSITRKHYTEEDLQEMDSIIKKHHEMYLSFFENNHLTTKFHLMLH